ncbi:MAG: galactokinase [Treponemataceae bacterium]
MKEKLLKDFVKIFGTGDDKANIRSFFSPGRVNLIGEHTDYNGGHVFPCALTIGTYFTVRIRQDKKLRFFSKNFEELGIIEEDLDNPVWKKESDWANYPMGIIWALGQKNYKIPYGFDILLYGNIPNGSGLSSSASVEVGTATFLNEYFGFGISAQEIALIGQYSENKFNKVNCGIMDQFSIAMGKKDMAIFLDTANLNFTYAPIKLENAKIVITCSNKKRGLGDSKYNERRKECEKALSDLQKITSIKTLADLSEEEFEKYKYAIGSEVLRKRAKHAVYENQRTIKAVEALNSGDIEKFGHLMIESHNSLRYDYEVTGIELDTLVEESLKQEGVIGSRMTGAGFGGCTVSIVQGEKIDKFIENVGNAYKAKIGYNADFYVVQIGDGAREI